MEPTTVTFELHSDCIGLQAMSAVVQVMRYFRQTGERWPTDSEADSDLVRLVLDTAKKLIEEEICWEKQ